jgi:hypothetical protein
MDFQEKRSEERQRVGIPVKMLVKNKKIKCIFTNFSTGGALIKVDSEDKLISQEIVGEEVYFEFENNYSETLIFGKIVRILQDSDKICLAVSFVGSGVNFNPNKA